MHSIIIVVYSIIDRFPRILKWKIIRLKEVKTSFVRPEGPKALPKKTGFNFMIFILTL